jgi:hypothetical protein
MDSFKRESSLLSHVSKYAKRLRFSLQEAEMPFYEYRIDLFAFSELQDLTVAVELKLHRWKRAVEQAILYQLCADRVFIALPETTARRVDWSVLERHGIGMIAVSATGRCRRIVCSQPSKVIIPDYRQSYIDMLKAA